MSMEISYWGAFRGRGGAPMLILEDSKTPYTWNKINGEARAKIVAENKGVFAPPFLKDGDVVLAQVRLQPPRSAALVRGVNSTETRAIDDEHLCISRKEAWVLPRG